MGLAIKLSSLHTEVCFESHRTIQFYSDSSRSFWYLEPPRAVTLGICGGFSGKFPRKASREKTQLNCGAVVYLSGGRIRPRGPANCISVGRSHKHKEHRGLKVAVTRDLHFAEPVTSASSAPERRAFIQLFSQGAFRTAGSNPFIGGLTLASSTSASELIIRATLGIYF